MKETLITDNMHPNKETQQRTTLQNRSLHLALTQISRDMVQQGFDQRMILDSLKGYSVPVTPEFLKEVFKSIIFQLYRKTSTKDLTTSQMTEAFDVLGKFLGENFGYEAVWPSLETLMLAQLDDDKYMA